MTGRRAALIAAGGAAAATLGDLLMLYVGNAQRPELGLAPVPDGALQVGCALGVLGIPLYALGYRAAAGLVAVQSRFAAQVIIGAGLLMAVLGAAIHGYTGYLIAGSGHGRAAAPVAAVVASGPLLVGLWLATGLAVIVGSAAFAWHTVARRARWLRVAGICNPAALTVLLALAGASDPLLQAFLLPAAPNLAHLAFFALLVGGFSRGCSRV